MIPKSIRKILNSDKDENYKAFIKTKFRNKRINRGLYLRSISSIGLLDFGYIRNLENFNQSPGRKKKYQIDKQKAMEYLDKYAKSESVRKLGALRLPYIIYLHRKINLGQNIITQSKDLWHKYK